jgi:hypothetical protein
MIRAATADQEVVAAFPKEAVLASATFEPIHPLAAKERVVAALAEKPVAAPTGVVHVIAAAKTADIIALMAAKPVPARAGILEQRGEDDVEAVAGARSGRIGRRDDDGQRLLGECWTGDQPIGFERQSIRQRHAIREPGGEDQCIAVRISEGLRQRHERFPARSDRCIGDRSHQLQCVGKGFGAARRFGGLLTFAG